MWPVAQQVKAKSHMSLGDESSYLASSKFALCLRAGALQGILD